MADPYSEGFVSYVDLHQEDAGHCVMCGYASARKHSDVITLEFHTRHVNHQIKLCPTHLYQVCDAITEWKRGSII